MEGSSRLFCYITSKSRGGIFAGTVSELASKLELDYNFELLELKTLESEGHVQVFYFDEGNVLVKIMSHRLQI